MSLMNLTKKKLTGLDPNTGQLVRSVPDWVGFLHGVGFPLVVTPSTDESYGGDGGSLAFPFKLI